jgi:hypothetical protein
MRDEVASIEASLYCMEDSKTLSEAIDITSEETTGMMGCALNLMWTMQAQQCTQRKHKLNMYRKWRQKGNTRWSKSSPTSTLLIGTVKQTLQEM